ncbi:MAG: hypothetical protein QOE03_1930 [Micromonosporaceae bacterium]|nr:hypothetical protein [Micromonosporaceae bacterium]
MGRHRIPWRRPVIVGLLVLATAGCGAGGDTRAATTSHDAIAARIQAALRQRPDVVTAEVNYQNTLDASAQATAAISVKPGTDLDRTVDAALRLIWQSKLFPLRSINLYVTYDHGDQPGTTRSIDTVRQQAELDRAYGPRPIG